MSDIMRMIPFGNLMNWMLSEHERAKDPLISFCEDTARLRSRSLEHARDPARQDRCREARDEDPPPVVRQAQEHRRAAA